MPRELRCAQGCPELDPAITERGRGRWRGLEARIDAASCWLSIVLTSLTLITLDSRSGRTGPLGAVGRVAHTIVSPVEPGGQHVVAGPIGDWWSGVIDSGKLETREPLAAPADRRAAGSRRERRRSRIKEDAVLRASAGPAPANSDAKRDRGARRRPRPGQLRVDDHARPRHRGGDRDGMAVLAPDGVVGHVIDSWHGGCEVRVLTDPDSAIAVRTTKHPATGIAQGHSGSRELTVADFDATREWSASASTSSPSDLTNSVFPPDLTVGRVTQRRRAGGRPRAHRAHRIRTSTSTRSSSSWCCVGCRAKDRSCRPRTTTTTTDHHHASGQIDHHAREHRRRHRVTTRSTTLHHGRVADARRAGRRAGRRHGGVAGRSSRTCGSPGAFPTSVSSSRSRSRSTTGPEAGALVGFLAGLGFDLFLETPLGLSALAYALTAYIGRRVAGRRVAHAAWFTPVIGVVAGIAGGLFFIGIGLLAGVDGVHGDQRVRDGRDRCRLRRLLAPFVFIVVGLLLRDPRTLTAWSRR